MTKTMSSNENEEVRQYLQEKLKHIPDSPGVYRFIGKKEQILYIGKAKSLNKRVRSYFSNSRGHSYRISRMVGKAVDILYTVTHSEVEALTLENNLIKEHQPRYNINLKDGKTYPYICIKNERFPRLFPTRNRIEDGSEYYGPFTSVSTMRAILEVIRQNFKYRTCNYKLTEENIKAGKFKLCLEYQIGNCAGPCVGLVEEAQYMQNIEAIRKILKGNYKSLLKQLDEEMKAAAENYQFERANEIKVRIEKFKAFKRKNTVISETITDVEVLTADRLNDLTIVIHFKVQNGAIVQTHAWELRRKNEEEDEEILAAVLTQMHNDQKELGKTILTNLEFKAEEEIEGYTIHVPQRGDKHKLVELSIKNCRVLLEEKVLKQNFKKKTPQEAIMEQLQQDLRLKTLPRHIECFDNSNIQGEYPVASLVVFKDAKPSKKDYRHFKIKTVIGPDDFASMKEIVFRRYRRLLEESQPLPDLIVVDGGKGQLSAAVEALKQLELLHMVPIIGIAKKLEELYFVNDPIPLHLDKRSTSLRLLQHLRNEAHRFAITFHRNLRSKGGTGTKLTKVEGIGEKTAQKILTHFRSIKKLKAAPEEEIIKILGPDKGGKIIESIKKGEL